MDLKEYQAAARSTAIYRESESATMIYPALGLVGECGEVAEKIKKSIRDDDGEMLPERKDAIKKELGDVMWYCANVCCDTDHDLLMIYEMKCASITHKIRGLTLPRMVLHMNRHASLAAHLLEKWCYIYDQQLIERDRFIELPSHLTHIVTCVEEMSIRCGFTIEEVCVNNIEKLLSRLRRGKIKGSRDDR